MWTEHQLAQGWWNTNRGMEKMCECWLHNRVPAKRFDLLQIQCSQGEMVCALNPSIQEAATNESLSSRDQLGLQGEFQRARTTQEHCLENTLNKKQTNK